MTTATLLYKEPPEIVTGWTVYLSRDLAHILDGVPFGPALHFEPRLWHQAWKGYT